uniref:Oligoendopeptidase f n=2 Tax=Tetraselmis sp. GSL018 TaxID=582737 RepID=A0A061S728_9CHLO
MAPDGNPTASALIDQFNKAYEEKHLAFENDFWSTKMGLKDASSESFTATKSAYDAFLADPSNLKTVREHLALEGLSPEQEKILKIMEKTFSSYMTEDPKASALQEKLTALEAELAAERNGMKLGYVDPEKGDFVRASSVLLSDMMRTSDSAEKRKACYEAMRTIGPFVVGKLCEIVKLRNRLARGLGYEDYYDYKVKRTEGFSKGRLFEILGDLEEKTRGLLDEARAAAAKEHGDEALEPWNLSFYLSGDVEKKMDKYFPFEDAVDVWARSFAALGIDYRGGTMVMDLCDREGKYSNGFCHWPQPAWQRADGSWVPSTAQLTSLATPSAVGSGKTALVTLMHEGGHAAHFANIVQGSPFFSQERAPTSVAYAENQSMFLDSLVGDGDWLARYARDREGNPIPWDLVEEKIRAVHPYSVFQLRGMISIPFFEKALYELPEDGVTPDAVLALADRIDVEIFGGPAARPIMSVPHILADESSAYYHGYVLAKMSVFQTRDHFLSKYGYLTDNPAVGKDLSEFYWRPGNSEGFLDLVEQLTGKPLTADAWVSDMRRPTEAVVKSEETRFNDGAKKGPAISPGSEVDMGMNVKMVHGDETISDSAVDGSFAAASNKFKAWVRKVYFGGQN